MSDSLRVRLEFKNFSNPDLRNSLLSFKKNETKSVKSLQQLIQKRFHLQQNIMLLIDGFVLEPKDAIDVVRDNDLILIEPKIEISLTKVKTEKKSEKLSFTSFFDEQRKSGPFPKTEVKVKVETPTKSQSFMKRKSKEMISSDSSSSEEPKVFETPKKIKFENDFKDEFESRITKQVKVEAKPAKKALKLVTPEKTEVVATETLEIVSNRNIPLRKAFQNATTSIKKRPQTSTSSDIPKAKKRRATKEATEPVDRFSPIIILERQHIPTNDNSNGSDAQRELSIKRNIRTQSARKSFPNPSRIKSVNENNCKTAENGTKSGVKDSTSLTVGSVTASNNKQNEEMRSKSIDFENCEPLVSIPNVGDIIAFKMLTLSADGNGYESSLFKMGSVLYVNEDTKMVDILLKDVIQRKDLKTINKYEEQINGIHSLKINWSTVLEPKIIERHSDPDLIIL